MSSIRKSKNLSVSESKPRTDLEAIYTKKVFSPRTEIFHIQREPVTRHYRDDSFQKVLEANQQNGKTSQMKQEEGGVVTYL